LAKIDYLQVCKLKKMNDLNRLRNSELVGFVAVVIAVVRVPMIMVMLIVAKVFAEVIGID
jgi:hypothetical protein